MLPLMYKAKAHSRYGRDIVGSERWQWQPQQQQQSHVHFQCLWSSEDTMCIKEYGRLVGEKATTVREPGNEHDQFDVAVLKDKTCTVGHLPQEISRIAFIGVF